jgi:hypothetical protein
LAAAVLGKAVLLLEAFRIEQSIDPLAGREFPGLVLLLDPRSASAQSQALAALFKFKQVLVHQ